MSIAITAQVTSSQVISSSSTQACKMRTILPIFTIVTLASASFSNNLNYRSPSHNHPALGTSPRKIAKRHINARQAPAASLNFTHGVASGDPYPDSVILWTRAAPTADDDRSNVTVSEYVPLYNHDTAVYVNTSTTRVCVDWKLGTDMAFSRIVSDGRAYTSSEIDYTIKVCLCQLSRSAGLTAARSKQAICSRLQSTFTSSTSVTRIVLSAPLAARRPVQALMTSWRSWVWLCTHVPTSVSPELTCNPVSLTPCSVWLL